MRIESKVYWAFDTPDDPGITNTEPSLTQQHFAGQCDINNIMSDFVHTGVLPEKPNAIYGDFTNADDFRSLVHRIQDVQENFLAMPPDVRARFNNDPAFFIQFSEDPANLPELHRLGLTSEAYGQRIAPNPVPPASNPAPQSAEPKA